MSEPSRPLRLVADVEPDPQPAPPRRSGWIAMFVGGWLLSQVVGALTYVLVAPSFLVRGVASGVAAAERLDHTTATVAAGAPLAALALWQLPVWATQIATVALATTGRARRWSSDLGLRVRPLDVVIGAGAGIGAQLAIGVAYRLAGVNDEGPARQLTSKGSGAAGIIGMVLLLAVAAPMVEELLFRGLLQQGLATRLPPWAALVVTAALFGVVHFEWVQLPGLFAAGLVFGGLLLRYRRLGPSIFAHVFFNASTVLLLATAR